MLEHLSQSELDSLEYILDYHPSAVYELYGSGFLGNKIKALRRWLSPCLCYSKGSKRTLAEYGNYPIVNMVIYRTPLNSLLNVALQGLTLGKWYKLMKTYGFDKFYHLALIVTVKKPDGVEKNIVVEKNEVINVSTSYKTNAGTETFKIDIPDGLTLDKILDRTLNTVGEDKFFLYDAFTNNCQYFIKYILESNGLATPQSIEFLFQDIGELVERVPKYIRKITRGTTDLASTLSKITGRGNIRNLRKK